MYDYIKGILVSKQMREGSLIAEAGGIGYLINTVKRTLESLDCGSEVKIYVSLSHREDSMSLTGFILREERDVFNILQSVSGVGVKTALAVMEEFSIKELINIMIKEDAKKLSRARGIGAKAAQKIIIELKDKLINRADKIPADIQYGSADAETDSIEQETFQEVQSVLASLGYSLDEIKSALKYVSASNKDAAKSEDILKHSLEYLSEI